MCTTPLVFVSFVGIFGTFSKRTKIQIFVLLSQYYVNITNFQITLQKVVKVVWWRPTHENLAKSWHFATILSSKSMCTHRHIYWRYTEPSQYDTFPKFILFSKPHRMCLGVHILFKIAATKNTKPHLYFHGCDVIVRQKLRFLRQKQNKKA